MNFRSFSAEGGPASGGRDRRGFLLIEVFIAVLILAGGIVACLQAMGQAVKITRRSVELNQIILFSHELLFGMESKALAVDKESEIKVKFSEGDKVFFPLSAKINSEEFTLPKEENALAAAPSEQNVSPAEQGTGEETADQTSRKAAYRRIRVQMECQNRLLTELETLFRSPSESEKETEAGGEAT